MARLIVEAVVAGGMARPTTTDAVPVTVSVTRADGTPVSSLTAANFMVGDTWGVSRLDVSGFQGGLVQIGATNAGGLYMFQLTPIAGSTWTAWSSYHVVIVVTSGANKGQTLAEITFPPP